MYQKRIGAYLIMYMNNENTFLRLHIKNGARIVDFHGWIEKEPFDFVKTNVSSLAGEIPDKSMQKTRSLARDRSNSKGERERITQETENDLLLSRTGYTGEFGFELLFD